MRQICPLILIAVALSAGSAVPAADLGDPTAGKKIYRRCSPCHQVGVGARHRVGPHLNGIFGRKAASHKDFKYSRAMIRAGDTGLEWQAETLDIFVKNPRSLTRRTRMSFPGLRSKKDRQDLIAYLRLFSKDPAVRPDAEQSVSSAE